MTSIGTVVRLLTGATSEIVVEVVVEGGVVDTGGGATVDPGSLPGTVTTGAVVVVVGAAVVEVVLEVLVEVVLIPGRNGSVPETSVAAHSSPGTRIRAGVRAGLGAPGQSLGGNPSMAAFITDSQMRAG
jgi:hypothetical protein